MNTLTLNHNNTFKILQLTDLHIGDYPFHASDELTFKMVRKLLDDSAPDLVVVTGDMIWSDGVKHPDKAYRAMVDVFNDYDVAVMIVYGNHDAEDKTTRRDLLQWESQLKNPVLKLHEEYFSDEQRNDYAVEIADRRGAVVAVLHGIDSGAFSRYAFSEYDWVTDRQISRFDRINQPYAARGIKGLVFQHIPLNEYRLASQVIEQGVFEDDDNVSSPELNSGFFSHLVLAGNIIGVFVGHDHDNNFCGDVHGVKLCYGNTSGYQAYGKLNRGGRVIQLSYDGGQLHMHTENVSYDKSAIQPAE